MKFVIAIFMSICFIFLACGGKEGKTIPLDKMALILEDLHLADKVVREFPQIKQDSMRELLEKSLLKVHSLTQEELEVNLYLYQSDYETYEKLLKKISEMYDEKLKK